MLLYAPPAGGLVSSELLGRGCSRTLGGLAGFSSGHLICSFVPQILAAALRLPLDVVAGFTCAGSIWTFQASLVRCVLACVYLRAMSASWG